MTSPLISAAELRAHPGPVALFDTRFDLGQPEAGRQAFRAGHLPGARYLHLDEVLSAKGGAPALCGGRHPLPTAEAFAAALGRLGLTPASEVVLYDAQGGMFAARAWWMLQWLGHTRVRVLDGGLPAWVAAGGALEAGEGAEPEPAPAYPLPAQPGRIWIDRVQLRAELGRCVLVDARAPERYRGEVEPLDPVAGHIPGALNRPFASNLGADGCFRPAAELRAAFEALLAGQPVEAMVHQCGSGVTACHNLLAMAVAGLPGARLYAGSWSEWCADPAAPVARG